MFVRVALFCAVLALLAPVGLADEAACRAVGAACQSFACGPPLAAFGGVCPGGQICCGPPGTRQPKATPAPASNPVVNGNQMSFANPCAQIAGTCKLKSLGCNGQWMSGYCKGAAVCCVPSQYAPSTPAPAPAPQPAPQQPAAPALPGYNPNNPYNQQGVNYNNDPYNQQNYNQVPSNSLQPQPAPQQQQQRTYGRTNVVRGATLYKGSTPWFMSELAHPQAQWLADGGSRVGASWGTSELGVVVLYNIPGRDGGSFSAGGAGGNEQYLSWVQNVASSIGNSRTAVILEPDALVQAAPGQQLANLLNDRIAVIKQAIAILKKNPNTAVYVDIGHAEWLSCQVAASILRALGTSTFEGFSINVSNFVPTAQSIQWGRCVSQSAGGGLHFVIDTSRNGGGRRNSGWCNPPEAGLGQIPTTNTGDALLDALLWVKRPGESDGNCNGAPAAGQFSESIAKNLIAHSGGR